MNFSRLRNLLSTEHCIVTPLQFFGRDILDMGHNYPLMPKRVRNISGAGSEKLIPDRPFSYRCGSQRNGPRKNRVYIFDVKGEFYRCAANGLWALVAPLLIFLREFDPGSTNFNFGVGDCPVCHRDAKDLDGTKRVFVKFNCPRSAPYAEVWGNRAIMLGDRLSLYHLLRVTVTLGFVDGQR